MGFLASSVSFTRYRVVETVPDALAADILPQLRRKAFQEIENTTDERGFGWVSFEDMLDSDFISAPVQKGEYHVFTMRLDTRRISPAVYKKHVQIASREALAKARERGRKFLSKDERQEIKDQVKLRLLARTFPVPATFDVVWAMRSNRVLLASVSPKVRELFVDLFTQTFDLNLEPLTPYFLALDMEGPTAQARLEMVEETDFTL